MNTSHDAVARAFHYNGDIVVEFSDGVTRRFPVRENPRLAGASHEDLNRIEISPFGLHWPNLDEDLTSKGIREGDFGQRSAATREKASV